MEVEDESTLHAKELEVIYGDCQMNRRQCGNCFDFDEKAVGDNDIYPHENPRPARGFCRRLGYSPDFALESHTPQAQSSAPARTLTPITLVQALDVPQSPQSTRDLSILRCIQQAAVRSPCLTVSQSVHPATLKYLSVPPFQYHRCTLIRTPRSDAPRAPFFSRGSHGLRTFVCHRRSARLGR